MFIYLFIYVFFLFLLTRYANFIAYSDISFATWEAMLTGRLHCYMPSWENASVSFLKSGGFVVTIMLFFFTN